MNEPTKPGTTRSARDKEIRKEWALQYMKNNPGVTRSQTYAAVQETFGVGIGATTLRILGKEAGLKGAGVSFEVLVNQDKQGADGRGKTDADIGVRAVWVIDAIRKEPYLKNKEIIDRCRKRFGVGVSGYTISDARKYVARSRRKQTIGSVIPHKPRYVEHTKSEPKPRQLSLPTLPSRATAEETIGTLVKMLIDEIPTLESLRVSVKDGKAEVDFNLMVVETRKGKISL